MHNSAATRLTKPTVFVALASLTALLATGILTGVTARLGLNERIAYALFATLGMALCSQGRLGEGARYGWTFPLHLVGYGLGTLALLGSALVLIDDRADALLATGLLSGVMIVKLAISRLYPR